MSTFLLVVIGVGACIGVLTSLLLQPDEPATSTAPLVRGPRPAPALRSERGTTLVLDEPGATVDETAWAEQPRPVERPATVAAGSGVPSRPLGPPRPPEGEPNTPTPWWQRLLAAGELAAIAVALGVLTAAAVGLLVIALFGLLRGAVG